MLTVYVLGAGASVHAGYPLCSQLWPRMLAWVIEHTPPDSEFRSAVDLVVALSGTVVDVEALFTDLDLNRGVFKELPKSDCGRLEGALRRCLREYFKSIHGTPSLYARFAEKLRPGDVVITFNYDISLENELIPKQLFRVKDGYGFVADWAEPTSDVKILKLHGSMNWIGSIFEGARGGNFGMFTTSLGTRPFVDNSDSVLRDYKSEVLDKSFPGGGVLGAEATLILPTYEKKFSISTSIGDEWADFFESLWAKAASSLQTAERIVVIGYSMPEADRRARTLLLWNANKNADVLLCCASSNRALKDEFEKHRFCRVTTAVDFNEFLGM